MRYINENAWFVTVDHHPAEDKHRLITTRNWRMILDRCRTKKVYQNPLFADPVLYDSHPRSMDSLLNTYSIPVRFEQSLAEFHR